MTALFTNCRFCRTQPVYRTRQRAIGARHVGEWRQCCEQHKPGSRLHEAPAAVQQLAKHLNAHEIERLDA